MTTPQSIALLLVLLLLGALSKKHVEYVNPFIGTGGRGFGIGSINPGPQAPFSMVRLGPDTTDEFNLDLRFNHFGGYYYPDNHILTFTHLHMCGAGTTDFGNIGVMPVLTSIPPPHNFLVKSSYRSKFDKSNEHGEVGYYKVLLSTYNNLQVELTASEYVGVHRYTFPTVQNKQASILFEISRTLHPKSCKESQVIANTVMIEGNKYTNELSGYILNAGGMSSRPYYSKFGGGVRIYFVAQWVTQGTDTPAACYANFGFWDDNNVYPHTTGRTNVTGQVTGAYLYNFKCGSDSQLNEDTVVTLYVGISFISVEQARINLLSQMQDASTKKFKPFDQVRQDLADKWEKVLSAVEIEDSDEDKAVLENKIKFYTSLFHTFLSPTRYDEVGGIYLGFDGKVHKLEPGMTHFYSDLSIWDVHRTQLPYLLFFDNTIMQDIVMSMLQMYVQSGKTLLPKWPFASGEAESMVGTHGDVVITDAVVKHILDSKVVNITLAYEAVRKVATQMMPTAGRYNITDYELLGYVPYEQETRAASLTLELAYDDWCISNFANELGLSNDAKFFMERSKFYKNTWNPHTQFFCPRKRDRSFDCPTVYIDVFDKRYVEGDAWHYRFFVPGDIEGLIELFGKDNFIEQLDKFMRLSEYYEWETILPNPYYWAGNEHDLMSLWMFNVAQRPDKAQLYARHILNKVYLTTPAGIPGNDDYGTMSAWFLWAATGLYPLSGSRTYFMSSPLFSSLKMRRQTVSGECSLLVTAHNQGLNNMFVAKVAVNGQALSDPFFDHLKHFSCDETKDIKVEYWLDSTPHPTL